MRHESEPRARAETPAGQPNLTVVQNEQAERSDGASAGPQGARLRRILDAQRDVVEADLDLQGTMDLVCARTEELTGAGGATILMRDGDDLVHRAATGFIADRVGQRLGIEGTFSGRVYRDGRPAVCHDTREIDSPLARQRGIESLVVVPLRRGDDVVGLLSVVAERTHAFDDEDLGTLELLSVVVSAAVSRAAELEARRGHVEALDRFRAVFEGAAIGIVTVDAQGHTLEANPALEQMLGYTAAELGAKTFMEITHPDDVERNVELFRDLMAGRRDSYRFEKRYFRKDGELIWARITAVLQRDAEGRPSSAISMIEDITERKTAEAELRRQSELNEYQALHDALTGLPNRSLLHDRIRQAILNAKRYGGRVAVLMMDLDRFKEVNDSLGHHAGDTLLKELGGRLQLTLRASDTVSRLGGDEFGLLLPKHDQPDDVMHAIEKIRQALEQPIVIQDLPLAIEASIGVAIYPDDGEDVDTLLQHADVAMYAAKDGNLGYAFYDEDADNYDPQRLTFGGELRGALVDH
jgi:diguanylate cyclase (GGDEF)-like protein/PAS domain S-box-containing protein